jgi:hypothetical protein
MYSLYQNEHRIFNLVERAARKGQETRKIEEEPNWAIIHIHMEVPQGQCLCSCLAQGKCHFFFLSFTKSENRRVEQVSPPEGWRKGVKE